MTQPCMVTVDVESEWEQGTTRAVETWLPRVLDAFAARGVRATLFCTGEIVAKCERKLKPAIASSSDCGAQAANRSVTIGSPLSRKAKQTTTDRMKATTWLRVSADMHEPIARNPPAISQLPM